MDLLKTELAVLSQLASRLSALLSTKTTKLPAGVIEELRVSLRDSLILLSGKIESLSKKRRHAKFLHYSMMDVSEASSGSVYEQLGVLATVAYKLGSEKISRWSINRDGLESLRLSLRELNEQIAHLLVQLEERRVDREYLWLAQEAASPYEVNGVIPLKESGYLVLASSPGLIFETAAPHNGLGESPADISVDVYLDTHDIEVIKRVLDGVDTLVQAMGYREVGDVDIQRGSIFRRSHATADQIADEIKNRLAKVERAFELAQLEIRQADVDTREAEAVNRLIASLESVPRACLRVGSVLLIKYPHVAAGEPVVIVRNLSQIELYTLGRFPEIQRSPEKVLEALATALANISDLDGQFMDNGPTAPF